MSHGFLLGLLCYALLRPSNAIDAHYYWSLDLSRLYASPYQAGDSFPYSPAAALALSPAGLLSWPAFVAVWTLILGAVVLWLCGPWAVLIVFVPPVSWELRNGNVHLLLAAATVLAMRWPAAWAVPLLTKPTCGVALVWHLVRREWQALGLAIGATAAIVALTAMLVPGLWPAWIRYLVDAGPAPSAGLFAVPLPLFVRIPAAAGFVAWGARSDRPWTVSVGAMLALPILWWAGLSMVLGAIALSTWGPSWIPHRQSFRPREVAA